MSAARPSLRLLLTQVCALLLAMYVGWHSYQMVNDDRLDIDRALLWMGLALLMLAYFAWDGALPRVGTPRSIVCYVRAHPVELSVLAVIFAAGTFVRLFRYGDLPPSGYVYFEEHINAGIGWDILQGDRPYAYPLVRYSQALGQWLFGPTTFGIRSTMIGAGILTILPFYLLMREVVDRPAALFATGLFASLRVIADTSSYFQVGELVTITTVWMYVRGLKTSNALWFIPVGVGAAVLLYEYETFKAVPLLSAPFAAFYWLRTLVLPLPRSVGIVRQRVRALATRIVKPIAVTAVVLFIGVGPMVAQAHRHQNIFFSSLDRQKGDRTNRGTPGLISPDAAEQLKWSVQVFTPLVKPDYVVLGPVPTRGAIDKITSLLLWAGVIAALAMFWRGARALFLSWFVGGVLVASLLLANFGAWKVVGFLPPAIVLVGFVADDIFALAKRRSSRAVLRAAVACAAIVVGVLYLNIRTLNANANDPFVTREWSNLPSQLYSVCDHLRDRPPDNYAYVSQRVRVGWGFSQPPANKQEAVASWSDWRFVCWGLEGQSVGNIQEAWPLYSDDSRPLSLIAVIAKDELAQTRDALTRAMPGLGDPDRLTTAPGGLFSTLSFATTSEALNERRGLALRTASSDVAVGDETIVAGPDFSLAHRPGADAFTLSGLVYAPRAMDASLVTDPSPGAPPVTIMVDGRTSYVSVLGVETPQRLLRGWHAVEVRGSASSDATLHLRWHPSDGREAGLRQDDFYALNDLGVWQHTRRFQGATTDEAVRFDYHPHVTSFDGLRIDARQVLPPGTTVVEDRWKARWSVEEDGTYLVHLAAPGQTAKLTIDGKEVLAFSPPHPDAAVNISLTAGEHEIELVFTPGPDPYIGGPLGVADKNGKPVTMKVRPF